MWGTALLLLFLVRLPHACDETHPGPVQCEPSGSGNTSAEDCAARISVRQTKNKCEAEGNETECIFNNHIARCANGKLCDIIKKGWNCCAEYGFCHIQRCPAFKPIRCAKRKHFPCGGDFCCVETREDCDDDDQGGYLGCEYETECNKLYEEDTCEDNANCLWKGSTSGWGHCIDLPAEGGCSGCLGILTFYDSGCKGKSEKECSQDSMCTLKPKYNGGETCCYRPDIPSGCAPGEAVWEEERTPCTIGGCGDWKIPAGKCGTGSVSGGTSSFCSDECKTDHCCECRDGRDYLKKQDCSNYQKCSNGSWPKRKSTSSGCCEFQECPVVECTENCDLQKGEKGCDSSELITPTERCACSYWDNQSCPKKTDPPVVKPPNVTVPDVVGVTCPTTTKAFCTNLQPPNDDEVTLCAGDCAGCSYCNDRPSSVCLLRPRRECRRDKSCRWNTTNVKRPNRGKCVDRPATHCDDMIQSACRRASACTWRSWPAHSLLKKESPRKKRCYASTFRPESPECGVNKKRGVCNKKRPVCKWNIGRKKCEIKDPAQYEA